MLAAAEHLGVIADPEISEHVLTPDAPLIILASDGIFEFLSNQMVIDMVSHCFGELAVVWMYPPPPSHPSAQVGGHAAAGVIHTSRVSALQKILLN